MRISIIAPKVTLAAELDDTPTARRIWEALPVEARANTWGEEVYFDAGVAAELEPNATDVVEPGTVCYWVDGTSIALPYGKTPASRGGECRLVTAVNVLGRIVDDPKQLARIKAGETVRVERAE